MPHNSPIIISSVSEVQGISAMGRLLPLIMKVNRLPSEVQPVSFRQREDLYRGKRGIPRC
ncbi:hypothetical protein OXIME_000270 [Oxyplasma meridianum]|uniref:Uncharacterized protein n=1 Tax=Oxyplasma meridianum TaxID=3073602 RepID=A0AAX4NE11_9ARCH